MQLQWMLLKMFTSLKPIRMQLEKLLLRELFPLLRDRLQQPALLMHQELQLVLILPKELQPILREIFMLPTRAIAESEKLPAQA